MPVHPLADEMAENASAPLFWSTVFNPAAIAVKFLQSDSQKRTDTPITGGLVCPPVEGSTRLAWLTASAEVAPATAFELVSGNGKPITGSGTTWI